MLIGGKVVAIAGLSGLFAAGCGVDACTNYENDLTEKYKSCGVSVPAASSASSCSDVAAKRADCLDRCISKIDCGCLKDPKGANCTTTTQSYTDCANDCPVVEALPDLSVVPAGDMAVNPASESAMIEYFGGANNCAAPATGLTIKLMGMHCPPVHTAVFQPQGGGTALRVEAGGCSGDPQDWWPAPTTPGTYTVSVIDPNGNSIPAGTVTVPCP